MSREKLKSSTFGRSGEMKTKNAPWVYHRLRVIPLGGGWGQVTVVKD